MKATPQQAAVILRRRVRALERSLTLAERENLREALRIALRLSSGSISSAQLRQMGHPYRRGGAPPQDPAILNAQSGRLRASWRARGPERRGSGLISWLTNSAPAAAWLAEGTARMIPRPFPQAIQRRVVAARYRRAQKAIAEALRG